MSRSLLTLAALVLAAAPALAAEPPPGAAAQAAAQANGGLNTGAGVLRRASTAGPPRNISAEYAARLTGMPDMNGVWSYTSPDPRVHRAMFDPANAFVPYEWSTELPAFGPQPGSYDKSIPYKPEFMKQYMATVKNTVDGRSIDPAGACQPFGMPRLMGGSVAGFDMIMTPDLIVMHFPFDNAVRKIFLDGRPHPRLNLEDGNDNRTWTGHSVGHWEGDTLVIDTVNILPSYYDQSDPPTSGHVHMVERIRLLEAETMENRMTIDDPVMFTHPWEVTRIYQRNLAPGANRYRNLQDTKCLGTDMSQGYQSVVLPMELEAREAAKAQETKARPAKGPAPRRK
jgi:hypothetical protein